MANNKINVNFPLLLGIKLFMHNKGTHLERDKKCKICTNYNLLLEGKKVDHL